MRIVAVQLKGFRETDANKGIRDDIREVIKLGKCVVSLTANDVQVDHKAGAWRPRRMCCEMRHRVSMTSRLCVVRRTRLSVAIARTVKTLENALMPASSATRLPSGSGRRSFPATA